MKSAKYLTRFVEVKAYWLLVSTCAALAIPIRLVEFQDISDQSKVSLETPLSEFKLKNLV